MRIGTGSKRRMGTVGTVGQFFRAAQEIYRNASAGASALNMA